MVNLDMKWTPNSNLCTSTLDNTDTQMLATYEVVDLTIPISLQISHTHMYLWHMIKRSAVVEFDLIS